MARDPHFVCLENMYQAAPINRIYQPTMEVSEGGAVIDMVIQDVFHHAGQAVHGSVYFKMLDDAAFFAANSLERETFVLTASFTTYLTRPAVQGRMRSVGKAVHKSRSQIIAEAVVYLLDDGQEKEIGRGNGIFARGKYKLADALGYTVEGEG